MPTALLGPYTRSIITAGAIAAMLAFTLSYANENIHGGLLGFFEWMETTWFGVIGKTWGAAFAIVQGFHLLSMAVLGGCIIVSDFRMLGWILNDVPARTIVDRTDSLFFWALVVVLVTGIFQACGVATKVYYLPVFWYKMLGLVAGMLFHYYIRRPLYQYDLSLVNPIILKMTAIASLLVWFLVAATGRWIGFSG